MMAERLVTLKEKVRKMKIANYVGYGFRGVRKDGRVFVGAVEVVRNIKDRTFVVIRQSDNSCKSFYMEDITGGWSCTIDNGKPVLINA